MFHLRTIIPAGLFAAVLTLAFWSPLWQGGGFVGGDVYSYYFPQKTIYAERLAAGELPLWHPRTGHGYPLVGESQTGVFYPFHLIFYRLCDVNSAYNGIHLLHYVFALMFTLFYARQLGLSHAGAALAAIVYTFGWFPSRSCVEWAIVGGAWLPAALLSVELFLKSRQWRYAFTLAVVLALQMLAGHFVIAFITQLTLLAYVPLRLWVAGRDLTTLHRAQKHRVALMLAGAMLCGFAMAAVQLLPTLELKRHSQRASAAEHELDFGAIPLWYLTQTIQPWHWYSPTINRDALLKQHRPLFGTRTNQIEAHLYFGLIPLVLALWGLVVALRAADRRLLLWFVLGGAALVYATGLLLPITGHLPGFSFFQGPGRYGIVTTLAVALLAGSGLDHWLSRVKRSIAAGVLQMLMFGLALFSLWSLATEMGWIVDVWLVAGLAICGVVLLLRGGVFGESRRGRQWGSVLLVGCVYGLTMADLGIVSRLVTYSVLVNDPPIAHLAESPLRKILAESSSPLRLYAPGANLPNLLGVASTPVYLTFGPAVYVDPETTMPPIADATAADGLLRTSPEQLDWLRRGGVTHVLSSLPLKRSLWPAELMWQGVDPFFKRAWGSNEPLYLYKLDFGAGGGWGRVRFADGALAATARVVEYRANRVTIDADSASGGRLILTDLMLPGWSVTVDGEAAEPLTEEKMYRAVDLSPGAHHVVWTYRPGGVYWGAVVSIVTLMLLASLAHVRYWHPEWLGFLDTPKSDQRELER